MPIHRKQMCLFKNRCEPLHIEQKKVRKARRKKMKRKQIPNQYTQKSSKTNLGGNKFSSVTICYRLCRKFHIADKFNTEIHSDSNCVSVGQ